MNCHEQQTRAIPCQRLVKYEGINQSGVAKLARLAAGGGAEDSVAINWKGREARGLDVRYVYRDHVVHVTRDVVSQTLNILSRLIAEDFEAVAWLRQRTWPPVEWRHFNVIFTSFCWSK